MSTCPARIATIATAQPAESGEAGEPAPPSANALERIAAPDSPERWTPDRQAEFLRELAATHCVTSAARAVGMSRQSAYRLRARLRGQPFDRGWAMAIGCAMDALAQAAIERALNGIEVPHYHKGELIGTSRRFDERLTVALLGRLSGIARVPGAPIHAVSPRDLNEQIERVEHGPETWEGGSPPPRRRR